MTRDLPPPRAQPHLPSVGGVEAVAVEEEAAVAVAAFEQSSVYPYFPTAM